MVELASARRRKVNDMTYRRLLEGYTVVVEPIDATGGGVEEGENP